MTEDERPAVDVATIDKVTSWEDQLVTRWMGYRRDPDNPMRKELAELRRGLGKQPGMVDSMHKHVLFLDLYPNQRDAAYIVGSIFGLCWEVPPAPRWKSFAQSLHETDRSESFEKKFLAICRADFDQLPFYLSDAAKYIKAKKPTQAGPIGISWTQLLRDVADWEHPDRVVQRRWAKDWWKSRTPANPNFTVNDTESPEE